jgi:ribose transport system substrate-binding protein
MLLASLALPLVHCGGSDSRHDVAEAYYLITTNRKIPYWQAAGAGLAHGAEQLKVKYEMAGPESYDPRGQKQELEKLLAARNKPTGILVSPADPAMMTPVIDQAVSQGIPVITIDSDAPQSKRLLFIGTNNYEAGRMGGEVAARTLGGKGNVVVFTIAEQLNLKERLNGYEQVFRSHPGIKVVEVVNIKGDPSVAFDRTNEILEKGQPQVNAFVCLEALACPEVAEVANRRGVKDKVIVAMDTDPRTLEWIQKGVIAATVAQKPFTMASFGVKILDDLYHHKPPSLLADFSRDARSPLPNLIDTGATLVDKNNAAEFQKAEANQKPS